ncbi:hydrogenase [candidate division MSBL1 archaeon SCGC-AAA261O19]|uniref:Hydrogenase n=2 Tax=candidate division MSBL1 TaxID=215777 RepID=A0A133UZY9_9EURY|nr:hydrogenase [candidate division MSBL1 archaeon SCGC-AAA261C02]KXB04665.1 hydrogenase [candidate division MSBL1 archaeon SCGC-AAA261O19]
MCLAVPGEIIDVTGNHATVDFGGAQREVRIDLLESVQKGDFVLVHVGYAIQLIDREEAEEMLKAWREVSEELPHA